ncbi:hypothetical protein I552_0025 [Mycobacterium xenopi 3993]|nr:hypothetical protein I552_0025 [Mycobacterium xenopi 3993]
MSGWPVGCGVRRHLDALIDAGEAESVRLRLAADGTRDGEALPADRAAARRSNTPTTTSRRRQCINSAKSVATKRCGPSHGGASTRSCRGSAGSSHADADVEATAERIATALTKAVTWPRPRE